MELTKKEADVVSKFEVSIPDIKNMVDQYMEIVVPPEDAKAYRYARAALTTCVRTRTGIDTRRLDLGKEARAFIKDVNGVAKDLIDLLAPAENHLREQLEAEDNRKKAIQDEIDRIERERVEKIQAAITAIRALANPIRLRISTTEQLKAKLATLPETPDEEFYQEFVQDAFTALEEVRQAISDARDIRERLDQEEADRKAEAERLEKQRKDLEAEKAEFEAKKRAADEAAAKEKAEAEAEAARKKSEEEAEAKKKQAEFDAQVAAAKKEADDRQAALDEKERKLAIEKARIAFEQESKRLEAEAKERADKEAKEAAARLKAENEAKEKAEAEARELAQKLRPDREKATEYLDAVLAVKVPEVEDVNVQNELATVARLIRELATEYKSRFNPLI